MITAIACATLIALTDASNALAEPQADESTTSLVQVRASQLYLGDGNRIEDGVLVFENGKIVRVGRGVRLDEEHPIVEHDGVLTAGIVVCQTHSGAAGEMHDATRSILPEARLAHAFEPSHSDFERALRAGITSLVLTPGSGNLVGGITAVVKSSGGSVVEEQAHLALSFSSTPLRGLRSGGSVRDGSAERTALNGRGARYPTSYAGAIEELRRRFAEPEGNFARVARGELGVIIEAWDRNEVARALEFATEHGLRGALRGAPLAGELAPAFRESGMGAILGPYGWGQKRRSLDSFRLLCEAGVPVAFALEAPVFEPEHVRLSAAMAISAGAEATQVWKALTSDAARIAGVDDRVGLIERGKDADFVLWSGDPLDLTSRVMAVYVDGELRYDGTEGE